MADQLERALLVAEITELRKQQSEAHISEIYVGLTREGQAARQKRDASILRPTPPIGCARREPGVSSARWVSRPNCYRDSAQYAAPFEARCAVLLRLGLESSVG